MTTTTITSDRFKRTEWGQPLPQLTGCILKQMNSLHKNALFLRKIEKKFLPTFYPLSSPPYSKILDLSLTMTTTVTAAAAAAIKISDRPAVGWSWQTVPVMWHYCYNDYYYYYNDIGLTSGWAEWTACGSGCDTCCWCRREDDGPAAERREPCWDVCAMPGHGATFSVWRRVIGLTTNNHKCHMQ